MVWTKEQIEAARAKATPEPVPVETGNAGPDLERKEKLERAAQLKAEAMASGKMTPRIYKPKALSTNVVISRVVWEQAVDIWAGARRGTKLAQVAELLEGDGF